jgi:hypothetical protein
MVAFAFFPLADNKVISVTDWEVGTHLLFKRAEVLLAVPSALISATTHVDTTC